MKPESLLQLFASFLNFDSKDIYSMHEMDDVNNDDEQPLDSSSKVSGEKRRKAHSLFQIMFLKLHNGCERQPYISLIVKRYMMHERWPSL